MKRVITAVLIGSATAVSAQELRVLMPTPGQRACYGRMYDRAHLADHPDQLVTFMALELKAPQTPMHREPNTTYRDFDFTLWVKVRGKDQVFWTGDNCDWSYDGKTVRCPVVCDGGEFHITPARQAGSITLTVDREVAFDTNCDSENKAPKVVTGKDDKVFRLDIAQPGLCAQLPKR